MPVTCFPWLQPYSQFQSYAVSSFPCLMDLPRRSPEHQQQKPFRKPFPTDMGNSGSCDNPVLQQHWYGETHLGWPSFRVVLVLLDSPSIRVRLKNHIRLSGFSFPLCSAHILPSSAYTWIFFYFIFFSPGSWQFYLTALNLPVLGNGSLHHCQCQQEGGVHQPWDLSRL